METIERRLKDYKGYEVWKITDNKGLRNETIIYMLNNAEDNINCFKTLSELKKYVDNIM